LIGAAIGAGLAALAVALTAYATFAPMKGIFPDA